MNEVITTGVDDLLALLKTVDKIPIQEAASKLNINQNIIQNWVDFLVEEEVIGLEYKFTKPFIYLNKQPQEESVKVVEKDFSISGYRKEFNKRAIEKNIPADKIDFFWGHHVKEIMIQKKDFFFREAGKRNFQNIEHIWMDYQERMLNGG